MPEGNNATRVSRSQRFRRDRPCPICGGCDQSGKGSRCWGFLSRDGRYVHCTRSEFARDLPQGRDGTFSHLLNGPCRCGETHAESSFQSPLIDSEGSDQIDNTKKRLEKIFAGTQAVTSGDPVDLYLLGRNIRLDTYPRDLRTHMALGYWEDDQRIGTYPAMIAVIRDAMDRPVGLHRTYLTMDGQKAPVFSPKKLTSLVGFSNAIQLFPTESETRLAIAEGIETALSFQILSGISTWSCISDIGVEGFVPPPGLREIIVAGDYDKAGILATEKLINRIGAQGTLVKTVFPDTLGKDWNDILKEGSHG